MRISTLTARRLPLLLLIMFDGVEPVWGQTQEPKPPPLVDDPFLPQPSSSATAQKPRPLPPPPVEPEAQDLERFQEPRLSLAVEAKDLADGPTQIRFMWLRTFHPPLCVRAYMTAQGPRLRVVRFTGRGGYGWGKLESAKTLPLAGADWQALLALTQDAKAVQPYAGLSNEARLSLSGLDGASWMLEVRAGDTYHYSDVWTPSAFVKEPQPDATPEWKSRKRPDFKPFIALCTKLIEHAGWQDEERY